MRLSAERLLIGAVMAVSLVVLGLQAFALRPHLWPAGAGLALSGENVMGPLAAPRPVAVIRPPNVNDVVGTTVTVQRVRPGGPAERAGLRVGDVVRELPHDPAEVLRIWRDSQRQKPSDPVPLGTGLIARPAIWATDAAAQSAPWGAWLRQHLGPLSQMIAFLAGAMALIGLGARGTTATLMTCALIATATANSGPLLGAHAVVPVLGPLLLIFNWLVTPLSFPIIGLAVLYFPHRAEILDRHRWIVPAVIAASLPMLIIGAVTAAFLSGADAALPALTWLAMHGWTFEASFALALAANVLIVVEGISRYRVNLDADERRRIQIVVFTGVPAVFAYALKTGIPLVFGLLGMPIELPWIIEAVLQAIVLLPAFGLPYAVAVKHVFSPRTVLRRSLQYAFARRTLAVLVALPILALAASLVQQRDQSIAAIVSGQPLLYLFLLMTLAIGLRYREAAQRWLDQRFFRAEYDAREILVSLASRVPYEADPRNLVAMVATQIDSALHPECIAVLAADSPDAANPGSPSGATPGTRFEPVTALRIDAEPLAADSGVITLLRWSDKPLEVYLDDDQSPVARLPQSDRLWLAGMNAALLVPIFAGLSRAESRDGSERRPFVGFIALGRKRSEEPYTPEDRELLRGIAVQMGVALDLSSLRKQVGVTVRRQSSGQPSAQVGADDSATQAFTPTVVVSSGVSGSSLGVGSLVDGKYRVDSAIGQGGMGAVFKAWDVRLERPVAIKVVRAELIADPDSRARFRRESQIVARMQHPSIVTVFDYGHLADGAAFLVMEFVPGEDLRRLLKREGPLDAARMAALMGGIADGVAVAHTHGIFHRDLKPENILLPESGTGPKVVDFGVAKASTAGGPDGHTLSVVGTIVGTPAYMAPEQLRGEAVDARADVFSLGVMAYEMITGRLPYAGATLFDIGMKQVEGKIDLSGIDPGLAEVIGQAIAYDRDRRPAGAHAFAAAVKRGLRKQESGIRNQD
ncbi:MAG TPA: protein kinase [Vicinamibacterales bacterium]|nr:protein kinase [Vicinamibacterales bacterium]